MFTAAAQEASLGDGAVREVALWPHWRLVAVAGDQRLHLLDSCSLASLAVWPVTELCGDNKHIRWQIYIGISTISKHEHISTFGPVISFCDTLGDIVACTRAPVQDQTRSSVQL